MTPGPWLAGRPMAVSCLARSPSYSCQAPHAEPRVSLAQITSLSTKMNPLHPSLL